MLGVVGVYGSPSRPSAEMTVRIASGSGSSMASSVCAAAVGACGGLGAYLDVRRVGASALLPVHGIIPPGELPECPSQFVATLR